MPKLAPADWKTLEKIFPADGWLFRREKGSHRSYTKPGFIRPVVIPKYNEVGVDIIAANMRTAKMSRERYFELLAQA
ncbi:MAG: type II toxin-antitoxin system HicA family toxin [Pseudomonadota bacterium]